MNTNTIREIYDLKKKEELFKLSRKDTSRRTAVFSGHWPIGEYTAEKWESYTTTLSVTLVRMKSKRTLGSHQLCELDMAKKSVKEILSFVKFDNLRRIYNRPQPINTPALEFICYQNGTHIY